MSTLDKLIAHFEKFPGVGVRQAKRFAFHVLTLEPHEVKELTELMSSLDKSVTECYSCHRFFTNYHADSVNNLCSICASSNRDRSKLLVVASDADVLAIDRSGDYDGLYFVLGGMVPLLHTKNKDENKKLRGGALKVLVTKQLEGVDSIEVILGFAVNPDGENTGRYVEHLLKDFILENKAKISHLGRGLSTGSELEYADTETIKSALRNRV